VVLDVDLDVTVKNVLLAFDSLECPVGGSLTHSGPTQMDCTGAHGADRSRAGQFPDRPSGVLS